MTLLVVSSSARLIFFLCETSEGDKPKRLSVLDSAVFSPRKRQEEPLHVMTVTSK